MERNYLSIAISLMFLLTFTHCLNHQEHHKIHLKTNQITTIFSHQNSDYSQVEMHSQNFQHSQIASGCTQQQQKKAASSIDKCQTANITEQGTCINRVLNQNENQKWTIFVVEKGKPDSVSFIEQNQCMLKYNSFGKNKRNYFLWLMNDMNQKGEECTQQKINNVTKLYSKCQDSDYTDKAFCIHKGIKSGINEQWNVMITTSEQKFSLFSSNIINNNSYRKIFTYRKCIKIQKYKQNGLSVENILWLAKP